MTHVNRNKLTSMFLITVLLIAMFMQGIFVFGGTLEEFDFDFNIDAGNGSISKISTDYFEIIMEVSDGSGAQGWFGFNITQNASGKTIEFKSNQEDTEWSETWCAPVYSEDNGVTWSQCDDIHFADEPDKMLYFDITPTADSVLVFAAYPILYTMYETWIGTIDDNENCTVTSDTVNGGEELYLVTITESGASDDRPVLWFICGQDPPETWPQHIGIGMANFLLSSDPDASRLRSDAIWKIVPVSNPNAVRNGLVRWNKATGGEEINVDWTSPSSLEVIAMKADIAAWHAAYPSQPIILLDMHAAMGAMFPAGSGIFGLNNKPNNTYAQDWADMVMAGTVYDDNPTISPGSMSSERLRGYAQIVGAGGATLEIFQSHNLFDWGDLPNPVTILDLYGVGESLAITLGDYAARWYTSGGGPPPPTGQKPKYTQMIDSFTIGSSGAWTDYNITAGKSVPKSSTVEIVMRNADKAAARLMGVRADGSTINRYIDRCPTDTVGGSATRMLVNVSATGLIECYAEDYTDITYYVTGYWQYVNFTEMYQLIAITGDDDGLAAWTDKNTNVLYGIPVNRTLAVICTNDRIDGLRECGIRTDGSVLARELDMEQADTEGYNTFDTYVQSSPAGIVEVSSEVYTDNYIFITGYFGANVNFTEAWTTKNISAGSWTNTDLTAEIFNDTDVVDFTLCNIYTTNVTASHGVRTDGSAINRYVPQGESIGGGPLGFGMSVQTDALGVVELYSSSLNELFKYGGYFRLWDMEEEEPPPPGGINKIMYTSTPVAKIIGITYTDVYSIMGLTP